ncbi:GntR family transcriptional regulator [Neisseria sp. ZJ106]|uniref:GntR family transcriptional regulator n=1 Tax=Neisseria lisongii TaxID=2912188 RepID=A0AAW5AH18_9NEIS|nr:GntR family transcriptional regulator [Neisseria lisongii]MCF7521420.1 GntR family transcriptional regulator [Neisseria lisongii]MCF7530385.1 GntR family transcriptional regulator [Neisseria lisongii]WCL72400.1 GntR family transcriptional regulator [Neisseria lisongii]
MNNEITLSSAPATSSLILEERHDSELFRVYASILDGITDHILLPGKKLTESDLCRQMVCSRNTVRGALSLLAHDKIVDLQPNRGAFVHVPDVKEMRDVFNARIEMETMILSMLAEMPELEKRLVPLYAMIEQEHQASSSGDRVGWNRLSNAFHVELARLLENDVLFDIMNTLCARSSLIVAVCGMQEPRSINDHTHSEHREILDLLVGGKRNRAVKIMRKHLTACIERLELSFAADE